jgi:hypothetical protein
MSFSFVFLFPRFLPRFNLIFCFFLGVGPTKPETQVLHEDFKRERLHHCHWGSKRPTFPPHVPPDSDLSKGHDKGGNPGRRWPRRTARLRASAPGSRDKEKPIGVTVRTPRFFDPSRARPSPHIGGVPGYWVAVPDAHEPLHGGTRMPGSPLPKTPRKRQCKGRICGRGTRTKLSLDKR